MGNLKDISGMKFGKWTVLHIDEEARKQYKYKWICQCECGTIRSVSSYTLKNNLSTNCGCIPKELKHYRKDLSNLQVNDFKILNYEKCSHTHSIWKCQCKCGNIEYIPIGRINKMVKCQQCLYEDFPFELNKNEKIVETEELKDYFISNYGNIFKFVRNRYNSKWIKLELSKNKNYIYLKVKICGKYISYAIHRLVGKYFCEGYSPDLVINHKDANGLNNYYKNLEWTTQKDNIHQSYITSGIDQTRNYKIYNIIYPDGFISPDLKGNTELKKYVLDNKLDCSGLSLMRHGRSRDFRLEKRDKNEI